MSYFTNSFNDFFKGLAANNNKDWFHQNKKQYAQAVKLPFDRFLTALIAEIQQKYDPSLELEIKNAKFRINRDIRFAKDKTPYKMFVSAVVGQGGRKNMQLPGLYIQIGVGEIAIGGGLYRPNKENLAKIRRHIGQNLAAFQQLIKAPLFREYFPLGILGQTHKRIPKEFKSSWEQEPLIANKQFYFMTNYDDENLICQNDFLNWILQHYKASLAVNHFLQTALNSTKVS